MAAYYNENDPKAAAWLRELIKAGHIADGEVDERSIEDVLPGELDGYTQCHFFAGIGGWSYALRLAGVGDGERVWTGSCPCQPFSAAGTGKGFADERHLWPAWFHLIAQCHPERLFGEQVASAMQWADLVQGDLEAEGYAVGYSVLGAHSVGAPHIRQRLYWMADAPRERRAGLDALLRPEDHGRQRAQTVLETTRGSEPSKLAVTDGRNASAEGLQRGGQHGQQPQDGGARQLEHAEGDGRIDRRPESGERGTVGGCGNGKLGDAHNHGPQGRRIRWNGTGERTPWSADLVSCRDGKWRPVEPGTFPLAHGIPSRVGLLRGYGNAIVPQVAAAFIQASLS